MTRHRAPAASGTGSPTPRDREAVHRLLGREPFTDYRIAVRCPSGLPAVLENDPIDLRGNPFPTRHWLVCRVLHRAVSRLEAAGGVRAIEDDAGMREHVNRAHEDHMRLHGGHRVGGVRDPDRVKCLHAHLAFALATGGNPVGDWILERIDPVWPDHECSVGDGEEW